MKWLRDYVDSRWPNIVAQHGGLRVERPFIAIVEVLEGGIVVGIGISVAVNATI